MLLSSVNFCIVFNRDLSVANDQRLVGNRHGSRIRNGIFDDGRAVIPTGCGIWNRHSFRIGGNGYRTVIKTEIRTHLICQRHRFALIQHCLCLIESDLISCCTVGAAQFIFIQQLLIKIVINRLICIRRFMISPFSGICEIMLTAVRDGQGIQINTILELQKILYLVMRIERPISHPGHSVRSDNDPIACL